MAENYEEIDENESHALERVHCTPDLYKNLKRVPHATDPSRMYIDVSPVEYIEICHGLKCRQRRSEISRRQSKARTAKKHAEKLGKLTAITAPK